MKRISKYYGRTLLPAILLCAGALSLQQNAHAAVSEAWHKNYPVANNTIDYRGKKVLTDGYGNSYVAGDKDVSNTNTDMVVVKYAPDGTLLWEVSYDGGYGHDLVNDMAIDGGGNLYVAGQARTSSTTLSYILIKYNPAGKKLWEALYNNGGTTHNIAHAVAVDADGNIYVTGESLGNGSSPSYDFATIKYNSAGDQIWVQRFAGTHDDEAYFIDVDNSSHVWVSGISSDGRTGNNWSSATPFDYMTIRYNANTGAQEFSDRYNGGYGDIVNAMTMDNSGNVYITGTKAIDNAYLSIRAHTIKYNANISTNNTRTWEHAHIGVHGIANPQSIAVDGSGNFYITGITLDANGSYPDFLTVKYNSNNSSPLWTKTFNGSGDGYDEAYSVSLDADGNVYVTGSIGENNSGNFRTIRYNQSNGSEVWAISYNGSTNGLDEGESVAVDNYGNVWVTGYSHETGSTKSKMTTVKYAQTGFSDMPNPSEANFWMHDSGHDIGNEPNVESGNVAGWNDYFASPDIWNRWFPDGGTEPQSADFSPTSGNYLYVRIHNLGGTKISSEAKLHLYWTRARLGEIWDEHWTANANNLTSAGNPMGEEITSIGIDIPGIPPGKSQLIKLKWFPPNPIWYQNDGFLFTTKNNKVYPQLCYLARIVSTSDPMHLEYPPVDRKEVLINVKNNNNIATKNSWLTNDPNGPSTPIPVVMIHNVAPASRNIALQFKPVNMIPGFPSYQDFGTATLVLDEALWLKWANGGYQGTGFQIVGPGLVKVIDMNQGAQLENMLFDADEWHEIGVEFAQETDAPQAFTYEFALTHTTEYPDEDFMSGQNYRVTVQTAPVPIISGTESREHSSSILSFNNQPEPFTSLTTINYSIAKDSKVNIIIHDLLGKVIQNLVKDELKGAGDYSVKFNSDGLPAGVYFVTIETAEGSETKKITLMR